MRVAAMPVRTTDILRRIFVRPTKGALAIIWCYLLLLLPHIMLPIMLFVFINPAFADLPQEYKYLTYGLTALYPWVAYKLYGILNIFYWVNRITKKYIIDLKKKR